MSCKALPIGLRVQAPGVLGCGSRRIAARFFFVIFFSCRHKEGLAKEEGLAPEAPGEPMVFEVSPLCVCTHLAQHTSAPHASTCRHACSHAGEHVSMWFASTVAARQAPRTSAGHCIRGMHHATSVLPNNRERKHREGTQGERDGGVQVEDVDEDPPEHKAAEIEILHFNDVYEIEPRARDPVGGVARFVARLNAHPNALVLFSGDALAPSLVSTVTKGEHMVKMLNLMHIKAACMGNHDFDFGVEVLEGAVADSNFPWLLSNAWDRESGQRLAGGLETVMLEHGGRKIGLMGLIEEEWLATLATLERGDVIYKDYVEVARELTQKLRAAGADAVIALTHMRNPNDRRLAAEVPELDLILGGHDHEVLGIVENGVPVIKSGTDFRNFSRIRLCFTDCPAGAKAAHQVLQERAAAGHAPSADGDETGGLPTGGGGGGAERRSESSWVVEDVVESDGAPSSPVRPLCFWPPTRRACACRWRAHPVPHARPVWHACSSCSACAAGRARRVVATLRRCSGPVLRRMRILRHACACSAAS